MARPVFLLPWFLLLAACGSRTDAGSPAGEVRALVGVATVAPGTVERTIDMTAVVKAGRSLDLLPDMPGKIQAIPVKVGDAVTAGTVLARMDTELARYQADQAAAAAGLAELGTATAEREFARAQALYESRSMPDQQFEQVRSGVEMARLQKAQAEAMKGMADKQIRGGVLVAPFDGVVSSVCCEVGTYFNPMTVSPMGGPQSLVSLVNIDSLKMDLQVTEQDVALLKEGLPVHLTVDSASDQLPAGGLSGRVESVGLAADAASGTFPVRVVADNPDHVVKAGTRGRVRIVLQAREGVLSVPTDALRGDPGANYVVTVVDGRAKRVPVTPGLIGTGSVEIASGLSGGEQVVVEGNFGLPDGALVDVRK